MTPPTFASLTPSSLVVVIPCSSTPQDRHPTGVDNGYMTLDAAKVLADIAAVDPAAVVFLSPDGVDKNGEQGLDRTVQRQDLIRRVARIKPTMVYKGPAPAWWFDGPNPSTYSGGHGRATFMRRVLAATEFAQNIGVQAIGVDGLGEWSNDVIGANGERYPHNYERRLLTWDALKWRDAEIVVEPSPMFTSRFDGTLGVPTFTLSSSIEGSLGQPWGSMVSAGKLPRTSFTGQLTYDNRTNANNPKFWDIQLAVARSGRVVCTPIWVARGEAGATRVDGQPMDAARWRQLVTPDVAGTAVVA